MEIRSDNASPFSSEVYDKNIRTALPYYDEFRGQILDIIEFRGKPVKEWLDLGCGTGSLAEMVLGEMPDVHFTLTDPAENMLEIAKNRLGEGIDYICAASQDLEAEPEKYDVITVVQSHHYLKKDERPGVLDFIHKSLKKDGIYIVFENVLQDDPEIAWFEYQRWLETRFRKGVDRAILPTLNERLGTVFLPITISEHMELLKSAGFTKICLFWMSYMQMGIYCVK